jgi:hypothetical protein
MLTCSAGLYFDDGELVNILTRATEDVASSFGPRNVPKAMRSNVDKLSVIEVSIRITLQVAEGTLGRVSLKHTLNLLTRATEDVASSFGPRNVPKAMRSIEILGIEASRKLSVIEVSIRITLQVAEGTLGRVSLKHTLNLLHTHG